MTNRCAKLALLLSSVLLLAPAARAQFGRSGAATAGHDHSTLNRGGTTLAPLSLSLVSGATVYSNNIIANSSASAVSGTPSTTSGFAGCVGSTVTITATGQARVRVRFSGSVGSAASNTQVGVYFLRNGAFFEGQAAAGSPMVSEWITAGTNANLGFDVIMSSIPAAGSVSACVGISCNGGAACTVPGTAGVFSTRAQLTLEEVK